MPVFGPSGFWAVCYSSHVGLWDICSHEETMPLERWRRSKVETRTLSIGCYDIALSSHDLERQRLRQNLNEWRLLQMDTIHPYNILCPLIMLMVEGINVLLLDSDGKRHYHIIAYHYCLQ